MMKAEEAIYILNIIKDIIVRHDPSFMENAKKAVDEAFDMAIEALKKGEDINE